MNKSFVAAALLVVPAIGSAQNLPTGPGREIVEKACYQCHDAGFISRQRHTEDDWRTVLIRMSQRAALTPEQTETVTGYVIANFLKAESNDTTKLNANKATAEQWMNQIGLTKEEADAVIAYREKHGPFREWHDVILVYGLDGRKIQAAANADKLAF